MINYLENVVMFQDKAKLEHILVNRIVDKIINLKHAYVTLKELNKPFEITEYDLTLVKNAIVLSNDPEAIARANKREQDRAEAKKNRRKKAGQI